MPDYTWHREAQGKKLYLTFDDGPIPEVTPWVLEQLNRYSAKATFFCVGDNIAKHPDVAQQVLKQGHRLANHTQNHLKGWKTELQEYVRNVELCEQQLQYVYEPAPRGRKLFRPPYGRISKQQAEQLRSKYELIMWDVLTNDYDASLAAEKCLKKSIHYTQSGSIIVFHDSLKAKRNMMYALPRFLEHFTSLGYSFETL